MTKKERAAELIKDFPNLRKKDVDRCMAKMPHHILFRHDRSECRCNYCGKVITLDENPDYLLLLNHGTKTTCPACGKEGYAVCDCYNYSNTVERGASNFAIFRKGKNGICYVYCIRIRIRLDRQIGGFAVEDYSYTESQRYIFADGFAYRFGREEHGYFDPKQNRAVYCFSPWQYRTRYTEPTWDQTGFCTDKQYCPVGDDDLGGTCLQYAQLDKFEGIALFLYIQFYLKHPNVEYLVKLGFQKMVSGWFTGYCTAIPDWIDWKQNDVRKMLGVNAYELRRIREQNIDIDDYHAMKHSCPFLSVEECFTYMNIVRYSYGYLSIFDDDKRRREMLRYIRRQNEKYAESKGFMTLREYRDYFSECRQLQYDWNDRAIRFPRCLADAHTRTSNAVTALRYEELQREKLRKDEEARRKFEESTRKRRRLGFEKDGLMIRIPAALHEIIDEGAALHHCVGGYVSRHAEGKLHILFIRKADDPFKPYFTMELSTEGRVVQVRGLRNCDPPKAVKAFVEDYKKYILPLLAKRQEREKVRISA